MKHYLENLQATMLSHWDEPALSDYKGSTFRFKDLAAEIARLHLLFEKAGIKEGDKIAFAGKNSARWAIGFLAANTYGAVAVPLLHDFTIPNLQSLTHHSESVALFTEQKIWLGMESTSLPMLRLVVDLASFNPLYTATESIGADIKELDELFAAKYPAGLDASMLKYREADLDKLIVINYTSGTTGNPKGIMLTGRAISSNVDFALRNLPLERGSKMLSILPMAHMYGLSFEFLYPVCGGCHLYFLGKVPSPSLLLKAFAEIRPCQLITVPLVIEKIFKNSVIPAMQKNPVKLLLKLPLVKGLLYKSIGKKIMNTLGGKMNVIIIGGAALSRPIEELMRKMKMPYVVGYGMTECAPLIGYENWRRFAMGSCGKVVDGLEIRVDSPDPCNVAGELQVKGINVMQGYFKNPEATEAAFTPDGWLKTGDLGVVDAQGNIFIRGRSKCMILSASGQNIYPEEIESLLNNLPHVAESIVVDRQKQLVAIVAPVIDENNPLSDEQLDGIMKENCNLLNSKLPSYSKISRIEILKDGFEHTPKHSIKRFLYT